MVLMRIFDQFFFTSCFLDIRVLLGVIRSTTAILVIFIQQIFLRAMVSLVLVDEPLGRGLLGKRMMLRFIIYERLIIMLQSMQ